MILIVIHGISASCHFHSDFFQNRRSLNIQALHHFQIFIHFSNFAMIDLNTQPAPRATVSFTLCAIFVLPLLLSGRTAALDHGHVILDIFRRHSGITRAPFSWANHPSKTSISSQHQYTLDFCYYDTSYTCGHPRVCINPQFQPCTQFDDRCTCVDHRLIPITRTHSSPEPYTDGATLATCTLTSYNCQYPRTCSDSVNLTMPCTSLSTLCYCISLDYIFCEQSSDCLSGDRCVKSSSDSDTAVCMSCKEVEKMNKNDTIQVVDDGTAWCTVDNGPSEDTPPIPSPDTPYSPPEPLFSFENCSASTSECAYPRSCFSMYTLSECHSNDDWCVCLSTKNLVCSDSSQCLYGDRCATFSILSYGACVSCNLEVDKLGSVGLNYLDAGYSNCPDAPIMPTPSPSATFSFVMSPPPQYGYNFDPCTATSYNCSYPRLCMNIYGEPCVSTDYRCTCIAKSNIYCNTSFDCLFGDRCIDGIYIEPYCVSCRIDLSVYPDVHPLPGGSFNCPEPSPLQTVSPSTAPPYMSASPIVSSKPTHVQDPISSSSSSWTPMTTIAAPVPSSSSSPSGIPSMSASPSYPYVSPSSDSGSSSSRSPVATLLPPLTSASPSQPSYNEKGYMFDTCSSSSGNCVSPRDCYSASTGELCEPTDQNCVCFFRDKFYCSTSSECLVGDRCVNGRSAGNFCISCVYNFDSIDVTFIDVGGSNCENLGGD